MIDGVWYVSVSSISDLYAPNEVKEWTSPNPPPEEASFKATEGPKMCSWSFAMWQLLVLVLLNYIDEGRR